MFVLVLRVCEIFGVCGWMRVPGFLWVVTG